MQSNPQELLKQYVQSQHFTSTAEIMAAMKELGSCYHLILDYALVAISLFLFNPGLLVTEALFASRK